MKINIDPKRLNKVVEAGSFYLHTPGESANAYVQYVDELIQAPTIDYGTTILDRNITPMRPGEVTCVVARPGNGKTSFMIYMARKHAMELVNRGEENKCVVYVTWEEPVESIEMSIQSGRDYTSEQIAWGKVDLDLVKRKATNRADLPLVVIGKSLIRDRGKRKPPMTVDKVRDTIMALYYEFGIEPVLICGDYVQKIPVLNRQNRVSEVTEAIYSLSELAIDVSCPFLLGVQATRDVDSYGLPIPSMGDAQWTSAIEQEAFRMLGLLRPATIQKRSGDAVDEITIYGDSYRVDKNLMIMALLKQRKYFPPRALFPVHFKPDWFELYDIDPITEQPIPHSANGRTGGDFA